MDQKNLLKAEKARIVATSIKDAKEQLKEHVQINSKVILNAMNKGDSYKDILKDIDTKNYTFIYMLYNSVQDGIFGKMIYNPNRADLEGQSLRIDYKDAKGFEFRRAMLKEIKTKNEAYISYHYKKPNGLKIAKKHTYFMYHKESSLIVASGFYEDDIHNGIKDELTKVDKEFMLATNKFLLMLALATFVVVLLVMILLQRVQKEYNNKYNDLLHRLDESKEKYTSEHTMVLDQMKYQAMSEIISMIVREWRQPLTAMSLLANNIYFLSKYDNISKEYTIESSQKIVDTISQLSDTINDLGAYLAVSNNKTNLDINSIIDRVVDIFDSKNSIDAKLIKNIEYEGEITTMPNELLEVMTHILNNALEELSDKREKDISIRVYKDIDLYIEITNSGSEIPPTAVHNIFLPYYTTKDSERHKGLGLYLSKIIVENHLNGQLNISKNIDTEVTFQIVL
jgi:signal transduction histidine kinase